ncbi:MAG: hypothetical protein AB1439_04675 [candidate division FCPU426 bacterium]
MNGTHLDLNYRLNLEFGPAQFVSLCRTVLDGMVFDEDTRLEAVLERVGGERSTWEGVSADLAGFLSESRWNDLHQIRLSNQWIKGMNVKISLVRRPDHQQIAIKGETPTPERRALVEQQVAARLQASNRDSQEQERERLFGSMLMTKEIVDATRQAFLSGRFAEALEAAGLRLKRRLEHLFHQSEIRPGDVVALLTQDPPLLLMPDLSGPRLKQELEGLGHLCAGALSLVRSLPAGEPGPVLKTLVLIGLLLERLENALPNPAPRKGSGDKKTGKPRGRKPVARPRRAAGTRKPKAALRKK